MLQNDSPPTGEKGFVGQLQGRDALVGLLVEGEEVVAYVCDAVEGNTSISAWFEGVQEGGAVEMAVVAETTYETTSLGHKIAGTISDGRIDGTLTLEDGTELPFSAQAARGNTASGLYVEGDEESLTSVVVDNNAEVRGLSKSKLTGWTSKVAPTAPLIPSSKLPVQFTGASGAKLQKQLPVITKIPNLKPIIKPKPDPAPPTEGGTLMIMVAADNQKATGHYYIAPRPDEIGVPTHRLTAQLLDPARPKGVLSQFMRVRVLDVTGKVLSAHYIEDPFSPYVEVPESLKGESMHWLKIDHDPSSFLVAVPDIKGARKVTFSRFNTKDVALFGGTIDLEAASLAKKPTKLSLRMQGATGYDAADFVYETITGEGPSEDRLDILFVSEGFQNRNEFIDRINEIRFHMWTYDIYDELRPLIKIHSAYIASGDLGAGTKDADGTLNLNDTPFQAYYDCEALEDCRLLKVTPDGVSFAYEVAEGAAGNYGQGSPDAICILVNDTRYGGAASPGLLRNSVNEDGPDIFVHEFGHAAIGLGDEYEAIYNDDAVEAAKLKPNVSGEVASPNQLKWIGLVHPNTPIPTEEETDPNCVREGGCTSNTLPLSADGSYQTVGMYEGAGYTACGSFRPTTSCRMRCKVDHFCAVCEKTFRDVFEPFQPPPVDLYMRDNTLDQGDEPSPANVVDPATNRTVKPWQSVDIQVDAPPFEANIADIVHENAIAGVTNRVYVTVHNRGAEIGPHSAQVLLYFAPASGGAPPFPQNWTHIGTTNDSVAGQGGVTRVAFDWNTPENLAAHSCLIAAADNEGGDPYPPPIGGLASWVRNSNNVTWRNIHVVKVPLVEGDITNYVREVVPTVIRVDAYDLPVGTEFTFTYDLATVLLPFPADLYQMELLGTGVGEFTYRKNSLDESRFSFRADLPEGDPANPFRCMFSIKVQLPGGTPPDETHYFSVDQYLVDPATGLAADFVGGNDYVVSFE